MNRILLVLTLFSVGLLAGCDAAAPGTDVSGAVVSDAQTLLDAALADFDRAYAALDPAVQSDDAAVAALMDETLERHFAGATSKATGEPIPIPRRFGPFSISFGQQQTRTGTLSGLYPAVNDVYIYNVTGTATGELEGRMESLVEGAQVTAQLRVNGRIVDTDTNEDNVTAEAIVTAPARATVTVGFSSTPAGGFPAAYEHKIEFQNPN